MQVRRILQINVVLSGLAALVVLLVLSLSLLKVRTAIEGARISGDIISATFERNVFRNDYLQNGSERAKQQWLAKQAQLGKLLSSAAAKEWDTDDAILVGQIRNDHKAVGDLFSEIVAGREKTPQQVVTVRERENRLLTQLVIRSYDTVLHARKLQESSRERLFAVIGLAGWSVVFVLAVLIGALMIISWNIRRLVAERIVKIGQGAAAVGEGDLGYTIGLTGDDEFVELSDAFDGMTAKLRQSYLDLEREVAERRRGEEALRESEERFRGTFENAAVGITLFDQAGNLLQANGKFCEILGEPEEELLGRSFDSFTHPDDREPDRGRYALLMKGELESYEVEKRNVRKDGSALWVRVTRSARFDERGLPVYSIGVVQDISSSKEAEEKLQHSRTLLSEAERLSHTGAWEWNLVADIWTFSDEWLSIHGTGREELLPDELLAIAHPDDRPAVREAFERVRSGEKPYQLEHRIVRPDTGEIRLVRARGQFVKNAAGVVERVYGFAQDITRQKRAEEALRESEALYRTLFNAIDEGFCIVEMIFDKDDKPIDYRFLVTNPSFEKQTRLVDVQGKRMRELAPGHEDHWFRIYGEIALTGQPARFVNRAEDLNRWYDVYAFRFDEPEKRQVAILFNDITVRKQIEEELRKAKDELEVRVRHRTEELTLALQELRTETAERIQTVEELRRKEQLLIQQSRLAAMGEMLANISHQWRQPLNVVGLILQELRRTYRRGNFTAEYLDDSVVRGRQLITHMSQTIDDFRNFFIPDRTKSSFDVKEVLDTTFSMVQESFQEIQVELRVPADAVFIEGFRNEYAQAIMNILMNARDVFRERRVANPRITVKISVENGRSVVTIGDNAGGIADELLDKVFEPYFTTKGPDKGTGIGLFMSRTIIEKNMHGSLTVRNTDEGAEFRIEV